MCSNDDRRSETLTSHRRMQNHHLRPTFTKISGLKSPHADCRNEAHLVGLRLDEKFGVGVGAIVGRVDGTGG